MIDGIDIKSLFEGHEKEINMSMDADSIWDMLKSHTGVLFEDYHEKVKNGPLGLEITDDEPDLEEWKIFKVLGLSDLNISIDFGGVGAIGYQHLINTPDTTGTFKGIHYKEVYGNTELFITRASDCHIIFGKNIPEIWNLDKQIIINELNT